jgi:glycosyltransferase involved in cell wall biosynthesis
MNINLVHPSLNKAGGAEKLLLDLIRILKNGNYFIKLFTIEKTQWDVLEKTFRDFQKPDQEEFFYEEFPFENLSVLNWASLSLNYLKLLIRSKRDKNAVSLNNYGEVFPFICDLSYVNSVPLISMCKSSGVNPFRIPLWRFTSKIYYIVFKFLKHFFGESIILTNSKFNRDLINDYAKVSPIVIYPPVKVSGDVEAILEKENIVLTVSRLTQEKNLEIIPKIAAKTGNIKCSFFLMGKTDGTSRSVLKKIRGLSLKSNKKTSVKLVLNPSHSQLRETMVKSSIYLSTQPLEAFGMAIVESMAEGCIPLVPKTGGPWVDILEQRQGEIGFAYSNQAEAARWIDLIFSKEDLKLELSLKAKKRSQNFDELHFEKKITRLMRKIKSFFEMFSK